MDNYQHVHEYLGMVRKANDITAQGGNVRLFWANESLDADGWRREFRKALDRRITLRDSRLVQGRKMDSDYQIGLMRDANRLRDIARRIRVYQFETPELKARFAHKLSSYND